LRGSSEQLEHSSEQLMSLSEQLERKFKQLKNVSEQGKGMVYRRICFALLNSHIVADDRYACRVRHGAWSVVPSHWSTLGEGDESDGRVENLAKELKGEYFMVGVTTEVISFV